MVTRRIVNSEGIVATNSWSLKGTRNLYGYQGSPYNVGRISIKMDLMTIFNQ